MVAAEAGRIGIAQRVVPAGDEVAVALELATADRGGCAPGGGVDHERRFATAWPTRRAQAMRHELAEQAALAGTADAVEGVSAMLEGRDPSFEGR